MNWPGQFPIVFLFTQFLWNLPVIRRRNPLGIRHPRTVKYLFNFHILVGLVISCLGLWLCWWAPSTRARENPYWSGLIVSSFTLFCIFAKLSPQKIRFLFTIVDVVRHSWHTCDRLQTNSTSKAAPASHYISTYQFDACHNYSCIMYIISRIICNNSFGPHFIADN